MMKIVDMISCPRGMDYHMSDLLIVTIAEAPEDCARRIDGWVFSNDID
jgi:hypothetical protein